MISTPQRMYLLPDPQGFPRVGAGSGFARWPGLVPLREAGRIERMAPRRLERPVMLRSGRWSHHPGKVRR